MKTIVACQNSNEIDRMDSSSGGIFTLLAEKVLSDNGVVFGASFADDYSVEHIPVYKKEDVYKLRGSKYVLSRMGGTFQKVKEELESNKMVLFCGTPCQVAGLSFYLHKSYDNLLLVDFICHGTPEQKVWMKYLEERTCGKKIKKINFRDKRNGWGDFSLSIEYTDGTKYISSNTQDPYLKGFIHNFIIRDACFACKNKGIDNRKSDITLGDLWGAEFLCPTLYDDKGTSLVMINSEKGNKFFESISDSIVTEKIDEKKALEINWAALRSVEPNADKCLFEKEYKKTGMLIQSLDKYVNPNFLRRLRKKIENKIHSISNN